MNPTLESILNSGQVTNNSGESLPLHSAVDREEGELLYQTIKSDSSVINTLEVGCAYGVSSLFICEALRGRNAHHVILDPFQYENWDGIGLENLRREGFAFEYIPTRSEFALPKLLDEGRAFDFVFIDGVHTFDHCLLDAFYSTRLLRVGGYLALDDVAFPAITRVVKYLMNYPCYELHDEIVNRPSWRGKLLGYRDTTRLAILRKIAEDERNWNWHNDNF